MRTCERTDNIQAMQTSDIFQSAITQNYISLSQILVNFYITHISDLINVSIYLFILNIPDDDYLSNSRNASYDALNHSIIKTHLLYRITMII